MKSLDFFQPNNLEEVKKILANKENTKLLAGGTDLILELQQDMIQPQHIIDLNKIEELKEINETKDKIIVGSMVSFTQLVESTIIKQHFHSICESARKMGSPQIRNMATIGGNIINGASAADMVPCVISLSGVLVFESMGNERQVNSATYYKNYETEKIQPQEILTKIIIPKTDAFSGYYKLGKRNSLAIARINVALSIEVDSNVIKNISVCLGAVGRFPFRVKELEQRALGKPVDWLLSKEPLEILENVVYESIKTRKSMPFKREGIKGVYKEAVKNALEGGSRK